MKANCNTHGVVSMRNPRDETGRAFSHVPDSFIEAAKRPSGPPAELFGKERIACVTSSPEMVRSADGMVESGGGGGCFFLGASRVASFRGPTCLQSWPT